MNDIETKINNEQHWFNSYCCNMTKELSTRRISDSHSHSNESWILPNNAVAESDLAAAIQAIERTFQEVAAMESSDETGRMLFQDIKTSLIEHLKRIVDPVADIDYQDYLDLYHIVPEDEDDDDQAEVDEMTEDDPIMEETEEEEIDEADLLDTRALQEAQQLRVTVRNLSQSVQEIREQVLKDSLDTIVRKEYTVLVNDASNRPTIETDQTSMEAQRESLQESLQALSTLLQDPQWSELPQELLSLQNTIEVIQKETDKDRPMSQTEAAIISRCNSGDDDNDWEMILSQGNQDVDKPRMTASDRLAHYFEYLE